MSVLASFCVACCRLYGNGFHGQRCEFAPCVLIKSVVFWDVTQRKLVSHRRFGTMYRLHLQGSRCLKRRTFRPLKMGPIRSPETSVRNQGTLRNIPQDNIIQVNHSVNLRYRIVQLCALIFCLHMFSSLQVCVLS